jgi:hypothetical protein
MKHDERPEVEDIKDIHQPKQRLTALGEPVDKRKMIDENGVRMVRKERHNGYDERLPGI